MKEKLMNFTEAHKGTIKKVALGAGMLVISVVVIAMAANKADTGEEALLEDDILDAEIEEEVLDLELKEA